MGVFVAYDALLFYFFWELALIPAYFLCSQWGGERRIPVTFKFFIYTFVGSLFMLVGIIYLYSKTPDRSFALESFYNLNLTSKEQMWLFWIMFVAFAVKMPIFPFHTWQPDTYEQSPTAVTMVLEWCDGKDGCICCDPMADTCSADGFMGMGRYRFNACHYWNDIRFAHSDAAG